MVVDQNQPDVIVRDPTRHFEKGSPNEQVFPNPFFGSVGTGKDLGNSNYNGMVVTARYQGRHGIFFEGSYTLGKSPNYPPPFFRSPPPPAPLAPPNTIPPTHPPSSLPLR